MNLVIHILLDIKHGGNGFPTASRTPFTTIYANNFGTFLGYTAGAYPIQGSGAIISGITLVTTSLASFSLSMLVHQGYQVIRGTLPGVLTGGGGTCSGFSANVVNGIITSINAGTSSVDTTAPTVSVTDGGGTGVNITCV